MGVLFLVAFLLVPAGVIAAIVLILQARARANNLDDGTPNVRTSARVPIAWVVVVLAICAVIFIYILGSALAIQ
ncbi:MAG: hypothetical protein H0T42_11355 [Deltaproteobacteria bacterium]|nr:hypothetical protein [Deltaproteobacteria bacterium]